MLAKARPASAAFSRGHAASGRGISPRLVPTVPPVARLGRGLFASVEAEDGVTTTFGWDCAIEKARMARTRTAVQRMFDAAASGSDKDRKDAMLSKRVIEIDGKNFDSLEGFYDEIDMKFALGSWGRNLDAFNDILRGGFGTPDGGFILRWVNSELSREALGYDATVRYLEGKRTRCHPQNLPHVEAELEAARQRCGETLFDILVEIILLHRPGGEKKGGVELQLQ